MVKYCAIAICRNGTHNRDDLSYFFPKAERRKRFWKRFCRRSDKEFRNPVDPTICSLHFQSTNIKTSLTGRKYLVNEAVPSIFKVKEVNQEETGVSERSTRRMSREKIKSVRENQVLIRAQ